jgi:hypothetical protein
MLRSASVLVVAIVTALTGCAPAVPRPAPTVFPHSVVIGPNGITFTDAVGDPSVRVSYGATFQMFVARVTKVLGTPKPEYTNHPTDLYAYRWGGFIVTGALGGGKEGSVGVQATRHKVGAYTVVTASGLTIGGELSLQGSHDSCALNSQMRYNRSGPSRADGSVTVGTLTTGGRIDFISAPRFVDLC